MPTNTERIGALERLAAQYLARIERLEADMRGAVEREQRSEQRVAALERIRDVLVHRVEELERGRERWAGRLWAVVGPVLGALLGGLAGYLLRK